MQPFESIKTTLLEIQSSAVGPLRTNLVDRRLKRLLDQRDVVTDGSVISVAFQVMWVSSVMKKQMQLQNRHSPYLSLV